MSAANEIISLTAICRPNYLSNPALTVQVHHDLEIALSFLICGSPGHIHWGVLHHFAAIMFLIFLVGGLRDQGKPGIIILQVISRPDQEEHVRSSIVKGVADMEALRGIPAADKAITILHALKPSTISATGLQISARTKRLTSFISRGISRSHTWIHRGSVHSGAAVFANYTLHSPAWYLE